MLIRPAQPTDLPALVRIFGETRRQMFHWADQTRFGPDDFAKQTAGEIVFVAETPANNLHGFISVWEPDRFIHHLFVVPGEQRRGTGKLLLESLRTWLPLPYRLKCVAANQLARAFYAKHGWIEVGRGHGEDGEYLLFEFR